MIYSLKCIKCKQLVTLRIQGHRVETLFILSRGSKQLVKITLCSLETIYIHSIFSIAFFWFSPHFDCFENLLCFLLKYVFLKLSTKHFINLSKGGPYMLLLCNPYSVSPYLQDCLSSRSMQLKKEVLG